MLCAKLTDDFMIAGTLQDLKWFAELIQQQFKVSKIVIDSTLHFNGMQITQDETGTITTDMQSYVKRLKLIPIDRLRRKEQTSLATDIEKKAYRRLTGTLLWLGRGVLPPATFVNSIMQQKLGHLTVKNLCDGNGMVKEILQLKPVNVFHAPTSIVTDMFVSSFADASYNISSTQCYGQTGIVNGIVIKQEGMDELLYHLTDWTSHKQRLVTNSSYGAEISACMSADDHSYNIPAIVSILCSNML